jgi:thiol:disulfide interchange protein DsbA
MKRLLVTLFAVLIAPFATANDLKPGQDYIVLDQPISSNAPGKVEVVEFFSYMCNHCMDFNPILKDWTAKQAKDVSVRMVPVSLGRPAWDRLSALFYAAEMTGNLDRLHAAAFTAIHGERTNFSSNEKIFEWVAAKGVDVKKFRDAFESFGMQSQIRRGEQDYTNSKSDGTPSLVIGGRYLVNNRAIGSNADRLRIADGLVALARKDLAAAKK